ncbi:transcriptional regulator with XRE-family HTH domain [Bradyrhizobium sp. GM6.1]
MTTVHSRIRQARNAKNMTQQQLADATGVSLKAVSDWETGATPRDPMLEKIATALGVTVDHLLGVAKGATKDIVTILREAKREIGTLTGLGDDDFELKMVVAG